MARQDWLYEIRLHEAEDEIRAALAGRDEDEPVLTEPAEEDDNG